MNQREFDPVEIAGHFDLGEQIASARRFGSGHINDTFLVTGAQGGRWVLQRINSQVFAAPEEVMENIQRVTTSQAAQIDDPRRRLTLVPTRRGEWWHRAADTGEVWRVFDFIADTIELEPPITPGQFEAVGQAFGQFLVQASQIRPEELHVTIPDFHNEPRYVARLRAAVWADAVGRAALVAPEIAQVLAHEPFAQQFDALDLPTRVTHNDAKVSNVLFDAATREPLCVVDLDTVQPGWAINDLGDATRSGASTAAEDEADLSRVRFAPELFAAFVRGYLATCGSVLTPAEIAHLRDGAKAMTLETSLRFLTDYLEGDVYFRVAHPEHNLIRARNQLALISDIDSHWNQMGQIVNETAAALGLESQPSTERAQP